jgi:hypothetical protein
MNHCERPQRKDAVEDAEEGDAGPLAANRGAPDSLPSVIPEIDIWRVANLMLKRYGDQAEAESAIRSAELAANGDSGGAAVELALDRGRPILFGRSRG